MTKRLSVFLLCVLTACVCNAQFIKGTSIDAQIGYGLSAPLNTEDDIINSGFYLQGDYVMTVASWVELRPYLGMVITNSDGKDTNDVPTDLKTETKAALLGGKIRLRAPIPYVAPYMEGGLGVSLGSFETRTSVEEINKNGAILHIPFTLGLQLGRNHAVDVAFVYYFQPAVSQFTGAAAIGVNIPLKSKKSASVSQ